MKLNFFHSNNFKLKIKIEFLFLLVLVFITFISLNFYNNKRQAQIHTWINILNNSYLKKTINYGLSKQEPRFIEKRYLIKAGENLKNVLVNHSVPRSEVEKIINILSTKTDLKKLKENDQI